MPGVPAGLLIFAAAAFGQDPSLAQAGKQVFNDQGCYGCHTIGKVGTPIGPDLSTMGSKHSEEYLRAWLIDPSAYGGHREIDLAMLRLFGAPSERIFGAYEDEAPLAAGFQERVGLYQLLPLLVHALLFGGSYRQSAERMAYRYAG